MGTQLKLYLSSPAKASTPDRLKPLLQQDCTMTEWCVGRTLPNGGVANFSNSTDYPLPILDIAEEI